MLSFLAQCLFTEFCFDRLPQIYGCHQEIVQIWPISSISWPSLFCLCFDLKQSQGTKPISRNGYGPAWLRRSIDPIAMPCWWAPIRMKQLPMAASARVIWLCACVRYWPDRGLVHACPLLDVCLKVLLVEVNNTLRGLHNYSDHTKTERNYRAIICSKKFILKNNTFLDDV